MDTGSEEGEAGTFSFAAVTMAGHALNILHEKSQRTVLSIHVCVVPRSLMKSHAVPLHPTWDVTHPSPRSPPVSHLLAS